ncbi:MAG: 4-hydroxyphenylacetate 3-hydroxylase [Phenylobacterium sp.]|nr:4-hydroxyphenylacetate 3-hydroxylase [Phenylobacterium sp.]
MMTGSQYRASLADGRKVYLDGRRVEDFDAHPELALPLDHAAKGYDRFYEPGPDRENAYLTPPRSPEALRARSAMRPDSLTGMTYTCSMTLLTCADRIAAERPQGRDAIHRFVEHVRRKDLRVAECITDAKGDRALSPREQPDPDSYLRVVDRREGGVVIRGAKLHVSLAAISHELMVIPTKAMKSGEEDYAIACAVPANAEGVKIVTVGAAPQGDPRDFPLAARGYLPQCFVIFEDVFVPEERIFVEGEARHAATFAHALGLWLRTSALSSMAEEADALVGFAQLIAEANGLQRAPHVREKITDMALHATLVRATLEAAMASATITADGVMVPNELYANAGKYLGAAEHGRMIQKLLDIAGGSALTVPSIRDFENDETGGLVRKYMSGGGGFDGLDRARLFHAIRDLSVSSHGGRMAVSRLHAAGGLHAQRLVARGRYDMERAKALARETAGLAVV